MCDAPPDTPLFASDSVQNEIEAGQIICWLFCKRLHESLKGWQFIWSGHKRKREHGVGILLAPHVKLENHQEHLPARIISATICVKGMKLTALNVYAPTETTKSDATKSAFYSALSKAKTYLEGTPKYKLVTLGDFNATISSQSKESGAWESVLGHNNSDRVETNNNGERMLMWCLKNRMKIMNTIYRTKRIYRETWRHAATGQWKRIDYICTTKWISKFVRSCRVFTGPSALFDTDHHLLVMNVEFPTTKRQLRHHLNRSTTRETKPTTDYRALRDNQCIRQKLTEKLDNKFEGLVINDIDELNDKITTIVRECVDDVCPKIDPIKKKEPWEDATLQQQMKELHNCTKHDEMRKLQKTIKKRRKWLKNKYYKEMADNINMAAQAREVEKEFTLAKKYTALKTGSKLMISNEKLKDHFENHFAARDLQIPPELESPDNYPYLTDEIVHIKEDVPEKTEVKDALQSFKNNKSEGTDKVKTEGLKYNESKNLINVLLSLLILIWTHVMVPTSWLYASITCLYKKGRMSVAANYRGLSIGANMSRILAKIIISRMKVAYEMHISETQSELSTLPFCRETPCFEGSLPVSLFQEKSPCF